MKYKPYGVTAEPEVRSKLLRGSEWAYIVFVTDGISSVLSDGEIVDLARNAKDPKEGAKAILVSVSTSTLRPFTHAILTLHAPLRSPRV